MFCPKCGAKVADGALYCNSCGERLPDTVSASQMSQASQPSHSPHKRPKSKSKLPLIGVGAAVVVLIAVGVAVFLHQKNATTLPNSDVSQVAEAPQNTTQQNTTPVPNNTVSPVQTAAPEQTAAPAQENDLVTDCFTFVRSDHVDGLEEWEQYEIHIPEIQISGIHSAVDSINREIKDTYMADAETWASDPEDKNFNKTYTNIQYEWYRNGDILSLVIAASFYGYDGVEYKVYNVSVSTGQQLANSELVSSAGWSSDRYQSSVKEVLLSLFWDQAGPSMESMKIDGYLSADSIDNFRRLYEDTVSYVDDASPYLGHDGDLYIIGRYGVNAGGGSVYRQIDLDNYQISPYYSEEFVAPSVEAPTEETTSATRTVWRLKSSEQSSEATIISDFVYDSDGNLSSAVINGNGNNVIDDWEESVTYQWDASESCLLSSNRKTLYFNSDGQLTQWVYSREGIAGTYTYDSDGYPSSYACDAGSSYHEYYCEKSDLGNGKIQLDWYDESMPGDLQWYSIYQDGRMIEFHYCYLEPYEILFTYEQVELPADQVPVYLPGMLITADEFS